MSEWDSDTITGVVHADVERSMDPAVRDLWVGALRTGVYTPGYDRLRSTDDKFTPLGVLCDLAVKVGVCVWDCVDGEYFIAPLLPPATGAFLPQVVRDWAGITGTHPSQELPLLWGGDLHPIWRLSDILHLDHTVIAALIAEQY